MLWYILCYLVKGGSLFECFFGGFIIVVFFGVIEGFVGKREYLGSW